MGHRPSWLPVAPSYGGQQAVLAAWLPAHLVPGRFATEGLAWVRTSGGGRLGDPRTRCVLGGGGGLPPAQSICNAPIPLRALVRGPFVGEARGRHC